MVEVNNNNHKCACCGEETISEIGIYDVCSNCGWTEDNYQETYTDKGGCANIMSLDEAKQAYEEGRPIQ